MRTKNVIAQYFNSAQTSNLNKGLTLTLYAKYKW